MPGRKLRSARKGSKDYAKIHEGSPLPDEDEQMSLLAASSSAKKMNKKQKKAAAKKQQHQQQQQTKMAPTSPSNFPTKDGDDRVTSQDGSDVGESSDDSARSLDNHNINKNKQPQTKFGSRHASDDDCDSDDGDIIRKAEEKLKKLRKKEDRRKREEKLRRIQEETEQLEKSLKKKKRSKHQTTTADLRSMSAVVAKVDTLMNEKKLNFKDTSDSDIDGVSNNSSGSERGVSDSGSASEEEPQIVRRKEIKEDKGRGKKSDLKSGKEVKLTSNIRYPQKWPHSFLKLHYVAKEKKYDDLTLAEFCAGYIAILKICKPSHQQARIDHFEELMYHATTKSWKSVLNYHAACLLEIERGNLKWGANFQLHGLQNTILTGSGTNANPRGPGNNANAKQSSPSTPGSEERVVFCKNYQRGSCNFTRDHYGHFMGENQMLRHICAKCWLAARKQSPHSEQSDACPLSKVEF